MPRLVLPPVPGHLDGAPVAGWSEPVEIDTYEPAEPVPYPVFAGSRVYQGSSGRVYPLPFVERIAETATRRTWQAVHLQNRFLRVMVLPELGGRLHLVTDRTNGYDLFLRQDVIKPALVGLAGPWVAGGVELNWPQHHRPATAMPVDVEIEHEVGGAVTVWCSDHDPVHRMKGMHGVRLFPDRSLVELRVRLYNRTEDVQTFLWWANAAARVHDGYQSFFPRDVAHVVDHAGRAVSTFPRATGPYYGVDYPSRVSEQDPSADRLDWWRTLPVPTSYMCVGSRGDFLGGYDHVADAGFVHWADHHIAPGKKMWTWGNAEFGRAWERNLSEDGAAYVELMAGVFTDNQPDFSFLAPGETRVFSQWWYPLAGTGPVHEATLEAAVRVDPEPGAVRVAVAVTSVLAGVRVRVLDAAGDELAAWVQDLAPGEPLAAATDVVGEVERVLVEHEGRVLVQWSPPPAPGDAPPAASEPPTPAAVPSVEQLVLTGRHLEQYRHATRSPQPYWQEALRRDPGESGALLALSAAAHRAGDAQAAVRHARAALARQTERNRNPRSGEASYRLGLALRLAGAPGSEDAFWKATWDAAWRAPARYALALQAAAARPAQALEHVEQCLVGSADDLRALDLRVVLLRRLGRTAEAERALAAVRRLDPLDQLARDLAGLPLTCDAGTRLDVALDHASFGSTADALRVLEQAEEGAGGLLPLLRYHRAQLLPPDEAAALRAGVRELPLGGCFPSRLEDLLALQAADPDDPAAATLLATWLFDRGRGPEALALWRRAAMDTAAGPLVWRNLALAVLEVEHDAAQALAAMRRARELAPDDARLLWEHDQVSVRAGEGSQARLVVLDGRPELVAQRDDLTVDMAGLLYDTGQPDRALALLTGRRFQPWEGGEGRVLAAWDRGQLLLARAALAAGAADAALAAVRAALDPPASLGEARHPLATTAALHLALGDALTAAGDPAGADRAWREATRSTGDFREMAVVGVGEQTVDVGRAWQRLGEPARAAELAGMLRTRADELRAGPAEVDYFATSLPGSMLLPDDPAAGRDRAVASLLAQAAALTAELAG